MQELDYEGFRAWMVDKKTKTPQTVDLYMRDLELMAPHLEEDGTDVLSTSSETFVRYLMGRGFANSTAHRKKCAINAYRKYQQSQGGQDLKLVVLTPQLNRRNTENGVLIDEDQFSKIIGSIEGRLSDSSRLATIYMTSRDLLVANAIFYAGAKPSDLIVLTEGCFSVEGGTACIVFEGAIKSRPRRGEFPLGQRLKHLENYKEILRDFKAERGTENNHNLIVNNSGNGFNSTRNIRRGLSRYSVSPRSIRNSGIARLRRYGFAEKEIKYIVGVRKLSQL